MLKLKLQYSGHLMQRVDSLEKTLMLGGIGGRRRRGQQMAGWYHWLDGHEFEWTPGVGDGQGGLACCDSWGRKESDTTEWLNWTELKVNIRLHVSKSSFTWFLFSLWKFSKVHNSQQKRNFFYPLHVVTKDIFEHIPPSSDFLSNGSGACLGGSVREMLGTS